jgi:hypothetical protein
MFRDECAPARRVLAPVLVRQRRSVPLLAYGLLYDAERRPRES